MLEAFKQPFFLQLNCSSSGLALAKLGTCGFLQKLTLLRESRTLNAICHHWAEFVFSPVWLRIA